MFVWTDSTWTECGVSKSDGVLAALSGGADSVALLLGLHELQKNGRITRLHAAHLHHGIRREEADADETFAKALCESLGIPFHAERIDVPAKAAYTFFCPSSPDCYKNFEVVCEAARLLELEIGRRRFRLECTVRGEDNKYGWWLKSNWDHVDSVHFAGWQSPSKLWGWYEAADCLVYTSRAEAWGRPISEFATTGKPMLLPNLPYARETAAGSPKVAFFPIHDSAALKEEMKALVLGSESRLAPAPYHRLEDPKVYDWEELFRLVLPATQE